MATNPIPKVGELPALPSLTADWGSIGTAGGWFHGFGNATQGQIDTAKQQQQGFFGLTIPRVIAIVLGFVLLAVGVFGLQQVQSVAKTVAKGAV